MFSVQPIIIRPSASPASNIAAQFEWFLKESVYQHHSTSPMPTEIQCAITRESTETKFEFMLPTEVVTVTVPGVLNGEQCGTVIELFVDSITTRSTNHALTSS